jgi:hypothetical protein
MWSSQKTEDLNRSAEVTEAKGICVSLLPLRPPVSRLRFAIVVGARLSRPFRPGATGGGCGPPVSSLKSETRRTHSEVHPEAVHRLSAEYWRLKAAAIGTKMPRRRLPGISSLLLKKGSPPRRVRNFRPRRDPYPRQGAAGEPSALGAHWARIEARQTKVSYLHSARKLQFIQDRFSTRGAISQKPRKGRHSHSHAASARGTECP